MVVYVCVYIRDARRRRGAKETVSIFVDDVRTRVYIGDETRRAPPHETERESLETLRAWLAAAGVE
jgi:hypothetical protein